MRSSLAKNPGGEHGCGLSGWVASAKGRKSEGVGLEAAVSRGAGMGFREFFSSSLYFSWSSFLLATIAVLGEFFGRSGQVWWQLTRAAE